LALTASSGLRSMPVIDSAAVSAARADLDVLVDTGNR
jgi:hypothetical protein